MNCEIYFISALSSEMYTDTNVNCEIFVILLIQKDSTFQNKKIIISVTHSSSQYIQYGEM